MAFENAVWLASGVVTAALIKQRRHRLGGALAVTDANLQLVRLLVRLRSLALQLLPLFAEVLANIKDLFIAQQDLMTAAINRRARLHHHVLIAARRIGVHSHLDPADRITLSPQPRIPTSCHLIDTPL